MLIKISLYSKIKKYNIKQIKIKKTIYCIILKNIYTIYCIDHIYLLVFFAIPIYKNSEKSY